MPPPPSRTSVVPLLGAQERRGNAADKNCLKIRVHSSHRLFTGTPKLSPFRGSLQLFRSQSRLPQVIGQMIGTTQQDGEAVTQWFFQKVFLRHGAVLLQPVRRRKTCKPLEQFAVNFSPGLPNQLARWNSRLRLIGVGNEGDI